MTPPVRKNYKFLTIAKKLELLQESDKKLLSKGKLALKYGIPCSTLSTILKNRNRLEEAVLSDKDCETRLKLRPAQYEELESKVFTYFSNARSANLPVSGPMLIEKARSVARQLNIECFVASNGWLDRFKKRHNIGCLTVCGEAQIVDSEEVAAWLNKNRQIINRYEPKDIYNMDESGLFYNLLPEKTLALKGEKCRGGKRSKERLTIAFGVNMDGSDKLKPLVIGRFKNPRCFKNIEKSSLSIEYKFNKKSWMTREFFKSWLLSLQRRVAVRNRKILLLLDNFSGHLVPDMVLQNIELLYFPPNTTSVLQPLDQGIIQNFKSHYRRKLLGSYLLQVDNGCDKEQLKKWSVLDACRAISRSWDMVKPETIKKCFEKCLQIEAVTEIMEVEEVYEENPLLEGVTFDDFVNMDQNLLIGNLDIAEEEIVELQDDDVEEEAPPPPPSKKDAMRYLMEINNYLRPRSDITSDIYQAMDKLTSIIVKNDNNVKQTKINEFFKKK